MTKLEAGSLLAELAGLVEASYRRGYHHGFVNSEPMRIGGQPGHEMRVQGRDPQTGADIEIVQWLRFGTGAYLRILGFGPKDKWADTFTRFRAVRDGLEPR